MSNQSNAVTDIQQNQPCIIHKLRIIKSDIKKQLKNGIIDDKSYLI